MKKALLLWTLFTPLVTASETKEDLPSVSPSIKIAGERLEDWKFEENFNRTYSVSSDLNTKFYIKPLFKNSMIQDICLTEWSKGDHLIFISTAEKIEFKEKFATDFRHTLFSAKIKDFPEFLSFFYEEQYLPDCIINLIFEKMADRGVIIDDFRLTPVKLALALNQFLTKESREEDVQAFITQKLETVKDPARRQDLTASVIVNLQEGNSSASSLIKTLAQEVTDPVATPLYAKVKSIQSDIEMNDAKAEKDPQKRYDQALQTLLNIPSVLIKPKLQSRINAQIDILVKNIYNNDKPSNDPLPSALQDLKLNSDSMLKMLAHISQLTQENKKLQQQLEQDVAPDGSN